MRGAHPKRLVRPTRRRGAVAALAAMSLVAGLLGVAGAVAAPAADAAAAPALERTAATALPAAVAADAEGCGYADDSENNGAFAGTICWFDFSAFDEAQARTADGQPMEIVLEGGYTARFDAKLTDVDGYARMGLEVRTAPLEPRFAFGTDAYRAIPGNETLYSRAGTTSDAKSAILTFDDIEVVDGAGNAVTGFSFVAADTEDNVERESFVWRSDRPLTEIERLRPDGRWGCKTPIGNGTTQITCAGTGSGGSSIAGGKSTALLVAADSPTMFSTQWITHARSGIAVGIQTAQLTLDKTVAQRWDADDSFDITVTSPEGTVVASASTGADGAATTGGITVLPRADGAAYTLAETVTAGSDTDLADYTVAWSCENLAPNSTTVLPDGSAGTSSTVAPAIGDDIRCEIVNTALPGPADITCVSDASVFSTASDREGGRLPAGARDLGWQVGVGDPSGLASVASYERAYVIPPVPNAWTASPYSNADWISYNANGSQSTRLDLYFRYDFSISDVVQLDGFALPMDFYADNSVHEVWVNGVAQSQFEPSLPQASTNPYIHGGFRAGAQASTRLSEGFQHGENSIVVQVKSDPGWVGFLAQILPEPVCADFGDAPESYGTTAAADGARHGVVPGLTLGSEIDADADGQPSPRADGDDTNGVADEDALSDPVVLQPGATAVTVPVAVVNERDAPANLYGWIDADGDGSFEPAEAATAAVPIGATAVDLAFSGLAPAQDGSTPPMRLRLTTDALVDDPATAVDERALGVATDGEVEDHLVRVATLVPISCVAPFVETFGAGAGYGPALPAGQTTYAYVGAREPDGMIDAAEYALVPSPNDAHMNFIDGEDRTPGDTDGRMMVVNASDDTGIFFQRTFTGLSQGATYDFSAWITNVISVELADKPNVTFRVVDPASDAALAEISTGDILETPALDWQRYALQFTASQSTVRLELVNNTPGSAGNDLAIDDIAFSPVCEFGDAPASYGTLLADDGAAHVPGATRLGTELDVESDGRPSAAADGDDLDGAISDEDGITGGIEVATGVVNAVVVSATNTSRADATLAGWIDLDANGTFDEGERATARVPGGSGTADYTLEFPGATTSGAAAYARFRIFGGAVADPQPTGVALGGEVEDYVVTVLHRELSVAKSTTLTADSRAGDSIEYTVTATNTGDAAYTDAVPAVVFDDLSGVLDDATFRDGPTAVASDGAEIPAATRVGATHVAWRGPLAAGASVEITYSVTLTAAGDGIVRNVAWQPTTPPPAGEVPPTPACAVDGADPETGEPCATTSGELPRLTVAKSSDVEDLPADGGVVTYEVTVTNPGPGDYTAAAPARVRDDLRAVLDDASFDGIIAPASGAAFDAEAQELTWSGPLAAGESVTIEYSVTYDETAGDNILYNVACVPTPQAAPGADDCASVRVPAAALAIEKSVDPADGSTVRAGQEVTYTLSFSSIGEAPAAVDSVDDLSDVLDDATFVDGSLVVSSPALTATLEDDALAIAGEVPVDETITVSYRVRVDAFAEQGDHVLANTVQNPDGSCDPEGCPGTENPIRHLSVAKSATPGEGVLPGDTVEYTVTVTNDGAAAYTAEQPAVVADDMADVLDDATFDGDAVAVASDGSEVAAPAFADGALTWSGPLAAGESVTITYSVTVTNLGDHDLVNTAGAVCAEGELCDPPVESTVLLPHVVPAKAADPASGETVVAGDVVTYTLSWTNDGQAAGPIDATDDLSDALDDADLTAEPVVDAEHADAVSAAFDAEGEAIRVTGSLLPGETVTVTYRVTVRADGERGDNIVGNVLTPDVPPYVPDPDCEGDDCPPEFPSPTTEHRIPQLEVAKAADPASGATVRAGQEVTYTLELSSTGEAPVAVDQVDDLSGVLDDATFVAGSITVSDAALAAVLDGDRLVITGEIPADEVVTVAYSVVVDAYADQGDHTLGNVVTNADGSCQPGGCPETEHVVRHLSVTKSATPDEGVLPGDVVEYEVTVTNDGEGDYTADVPAILRDDMTDVLDDATFNGDAEAVASDGSEIAAPAFERPTLTWSGPLAAGESVTITYSVTVTNLGDHDLANTAGAVCAEGELCDPPVESTVLLPHVVPAKVADPASGETVVAGDVVTYTLSWTNDGQAAGRVDATDDLSGVLDDADLTSGPTVDAASAAAVEAAFDAEAQAIRVVGDIAVGETVEVTYQVTVRADGERGDNIAGNVLTPDVPPYVPNPDCEGDDCPPEFPPPTTEHRIPEIVDAKSANPESGTEVEPGRSLVYTLTFENLGEAAGEVDRVDDLTHVLDDADVTVAPAASDDALTVSEIANGRFSVTGTLEPGQSATVTYAVTVKAAEDLGDAVLSNVLLDPGAETPPVDACEGGEDCTRHTIPNVVDAKSVDVESGTAVTSGQELTYTLTFENRGSAPGAVAKVDDLTHVLDDADVTVQPSASDDALTVSPIEGGRFAIEGELAPGQVVTVSYSVTVKPDDELGDTQLANFLLTPESPTPESPADCVEGSEDCTLNAAPRIVDAKSVDPASSTAIRPGQELTYTLEFENTGAAAGAVHRVDDLTHVLDDADVTALPTASDEALSVSEIADGRFSITGELAAGQSVTVTYTVTVHAADALGDAQLANFLLDPEQEVPAEPVCASGEDCTFNPISDVTVAKAADPASGTAVEVGQELTYTLTFRNEGAGAEAIDYTDHMAGVLDDAELTRAPTASDEALTVSAVTDGSFTVSGELAAGQTVTVAYAVTVRDWADQGDHTLGNVLAVTGQAPPAACEPESALCTEHEVEGPPVAPAPTLPETGHDVVALLSGLGVLLLAAGGYLVARRRREVTE